jgi:peptide/nickel transport system substrate-binding protein
VLDALDRAIDRSELVRQAVAGAGTPARGVFPRAISGFARGSLIPPLRDLAGARRGLEEAGWSPGVDGIRVKAGQKLQFGLLTVCGSALDAAVMQLLLSQWREVGAAASGSCQPREAFLQATTGQAYDMALASNGWGPDPNSWARLALESGGGESGACRDDDLAEAMARGARTLDPAGRRAAYAAAEKEWLAFHCTLPLFEVPAVSQVSTRLHNFAPSPGPGAETWNAADWWLSPAS